MDSTLVYLTAWPVWYRPDAAILHVYALIQATESQRHGITAHIDLPAEMTPHTPPEVIHKLALENVLDRLDKKDRIVVFSNLQIDLFDRTPYSDLRFIHTPFMQNQAAQNLIRLVNEFDYDSHLAAKNKSFTEMSNTYAVR